MTIDVGTGDGRAVIAAATREPASLALGIDASAAAMAEASRRAARSPAKGGLPNARFLVAAAETLPPVLSCAADLVTVNLPWGSLLRGVVGDDAVVARGVAGLVAPGGVLELLLAPAERDGLDGVPGTLEGLASAAASAFAPHGLEVVSASAVSADALRASGSTWARRLRRPATRMRLARRRDSHR